MITRFRIQNYKALHDVSLDLTPIHVLIGPNDTGKTSILEAIAALCRSADHPLSEAFVGAWEGAQLVWRNQTNLMVGLTAVIPSPSASLEYALKCTFTPNARQPLIKAETVGNTILSSEGYDRSRICRIMFQGEAAKDEEEGLLAKAIYDAILGVQSYRWDARFLALPVAPDSKRRFRMEPSGFGLALCLDDILGFDRERFIRLEERFKQIFPKIKSIKLIPEPAYRSPVDDPEQIPMLKKSDGKGLYFEFVNAGQPVPARQVSDGVLLVLAYLALLYLPEPPRVLLIEEPENGIHPKRLQDVLTILRDLVRQQTYTQILLTTHSPYIVDLFSPEEVTLCQKEDDGSVSTHRLSDSQAVQDQRDVFALGEIWTAEGDDALTQPAAGKRE